LLNAGSLLKIITVGGSTTECHFLNDDKTWPYLLGHALADSFRGCWLNNAGMDGHSTYGHIILLNDHIKQLRPAVIVFLTGINDMETASPTFHDKLSTRGAVPDWGHYIFENSEVLNLLLNLCRGWRAQRFNNTTNALLVLDSVQRKPLPDTVVRARLEKQAPFIAAYRSRLEQLADTCMAWHILAVFLTQPNQFGFGRDPVTGADLALFPTDGPDAAMNGWLMWEMLERYNDVTRAVCREKGLPLVDLARLMPKNSLYFYDMSHFTNQGAAEVSSLVAGPLTGILREHFKPSSR
jgi:lysophospholipase L1-like esterase